MNWPPGILRLRITKDERKLCCFTLPLVLLVPGLVALPIVLIPVAILLLPAFLIVWIGCRGCRHARREAKASSKGKRPASGGILWMLLRCRGLKVHYQRPGREILVELT